jgi:hypothetical protein
MKYKNIREEELKNKVAADWFADFDATEILGNIDFTVYPKQQDMFGRTPLLWAEAKRAISKSSVSSQAFCGKGKKFDAAAN